MAVASWPGCREDSKARELLKVHINRTRLKVKAIAEENYIQSMRGFGYRLSPPDD
jgi:DNA-binding response OmpR family regulator